MVVATKLAEPSVTIEAIQTARKRFSETRLKELGDEYAENYPQLQVVLSKFYGLGKEFTINGLKLYFSLTSRPVAA